MSSIWRKRLSFAWGGSMEDRWTKYLFFSHPGMGRKTKKRLLASHSEEEILAWKEGDWKTHLSSREWNFYQKKKALFHIEENKKNWEMLQKKGVNFVYYKDPLFPKKLKNIPDCPLGLFGKGKIPGKEKSIAIVGARTPTVYGKEMAHYFARELSKAGVAVVSGLAFGIDVAAHRGALEGGGNTYGVLGCGVDVVYPKENFTIYEKMAREGGILSEYAIGTLPDRWRFPERNRIISGLSDGILVVEARKRSGSLITADCALEQGREVYALPGRALDPLSQGTNWLLREGAKIVTEPEHILEELFPLQIQQREEKDIRKSEKGLDEKEKLLYRCLDFEPKTVEELIYQANLPVAEGISALFRLELKGYAKKMANQHYILNVQ